VKTAEYARMFAVEDRQWWYAGMRTISQTVLARELGQSPLGRRRRRRGARARARARAAARRVDPRPRACPVLAVGCSRRGSALASSLHPHRHLALAEQLRFGGRAVYVLQRHSVSGCRIAPRPGPLARAPWLRCRVSPGAVRVALPQGPRSGGLGFARAPCRLVRAYWSGAARRWANRRTRQNELM
jgi:hypothetical protein